MSKPICNDEKIDLLIQLNHELLLAVMELKDAAVFEKDSDLLMLTNALASARQLLFILKGGSHE